MDTTPQFTASELASLFSVSEQTIRHWSNEFKDYLSPRANPGTKRVRAYTEEDLAVLALVAEMKSRGQVYQDIHVALASGQRGQLPDLEAAQARRSKVEERFRQLQTSAEREIAVANERAQAALARAAELEHRLEQVDEERRLWQQRATETQDHLRETEHALHAKEIELHERQLELARLQGELQVYQRDREQLDTFRQQLDHQRMQIERLETERAKLTDELMHLYRRLLAPGAPGPNAESTDAPGDRA